MAALARIMELMRLRAGPQDMPGEQTALVVAIAGYVLTGILQLLILGSAVQAVTLSLLTTILLAIYTAALLMWRGVPNRFRQTATALFATGTVFSIIMLGPDLAMAPYLDSVRSARAARTPATQTADKQNTPQQRANSGSPQSANAPAAGRTGSRGSVQARIPASVFWGFLFFAVIGIWRLVVFSHIYREALDTSRWLGFAAAIGFEFFLLVVIKIF